MLTSCALSSRDGDLKWESDGTHYFRWWIIDNSTNLNNANILGHTNKCFPQTNYSSCGEEQKYSKSVVCEGLFATHHHRPVY